MTSIGVPDQLSQLKPLARRIARGECVLVLGPGAAVAPDDPDGVPLSIRLSETLAKNSQISGTDGLDPRDLRHVSQVLYEATHSLDSLQETVADFYASHTAHTSAFHRNIAKLPFRFCLTTTPDDFLFNAFKEAGKTPTRRFYSFRPSKATEPIGHPTENSPLIYHLYGNTDEPNSLVITENDLIDALFSVIKNEPPLDGMVRAELAKQTTTCLFVDLGFKNWYLRALLKALQLFGQKDSSIAVEDSDFFQSSGLHQTALYFSKSPAIQFRNETLEIFSSNLKLAYEQVVPKKAPTPAAPEGAPRVFLSYAHDDREDVDRLAEFLGTAGLAVWQDHQNLRIGDRWAQALVQVIQKQVDYVVIVQSPALAARVETVVSREVAEGLARQRDFTLWGFRFVLPVRIKNAQVSPELSGLHIGDVDSEAGMGSLVQTINEDWKRRAAQAATTNQNPARPS